MSAWQAWRQRWIALLLVCLPALACASPAGEDALPEPRTPVVALIIDDLGAQAARGRLAIDLPGPVALSFLPGGEHTPELARLAHASDKEVMLHLPMQALGQKRRHHHTGELMLDMAQPEFLDTLYDNIAAIPHVTGINNHRGSLLTSTSSPMVWLMQALYEDGELFFVDSRTTAETVAADMAQAYEVPNTSRNVFLDNEPEPAAVRRQFRELVNRARREGSALAIGHPHTVTLRVLQEELPRLEAQGIRLVKVSELIERQQERRLAWQESLSP